MGDRPRYFPIELKDSFFILEIEWARDSGCKFKERFIDTSEDPLNEILNSYKESGVYILNNKLLKYKIVR